MTSDVVRRHVEAFNERDLEGLLVCFTEDAVWVTGTSRFRGKAELERLFADAFAELAPTLTIVRMLAHDGHVACELLEEYTVSGEVRVDHIAGFFRVENDLIADAKIYREGSAEVA